jgi:two-component system CheB/CheR fusion protein
MAHDGPEALSIAAEFRPDVVMLDLALPGMDGYEVAQRLRALPGLEGVALLALTGYADDEHRRRCDGAGFAFYFVKPADLGNLETLLGLIARDKGRQPAGVWWAP